MEKKTEREISKKKMENILELSFKTTPEPKLYWLPFQIIYRKLSCNHFVHTTKTLTLYNAHFARRTLRISFIFNQMSC